MLPHFSTRVAFAAAPPIAATTERRPRTTLRVLALWAVVAVTVAAGWAAINARLRHRREHVVVDLTAPEREFSTDDTHDVRDRPLRIVPADGPVGRIPPHRG